MRLTLTKRIPTTQRCDG